MKKTVRKLYRVCDGKLYSVPVEKETKKMFFVVRPSPVTFYRRRVNKNEVCVTPKEAVQEEKNMALTKIGMIRGALKKAEQRLDKVKALESSFGEDLSGEEYR